MEILTIVIAVLTSLSIVITCILKPSIRIKKVTINLYWVIALIGALTLLFTTAISFKEVFNGLISNSSINPIKILILFLSMTMISIFLDEIGFFATLANAVLKHTKDSQFKIFIAFYFLVAILTMFTSNDIIILTFTPFIIMFCKNAKISPVPYLVSEFCAANTWSMMFIIGNPTNIYLAESFGVDFISYFLKMAIPTLLAGIVEFSLLILIFYRKLKTSIQHELEDLPRLNTFLTAYGLTILITCTIMLVISSYVSIPMYLIALISLLTLSVGVLTYAIVKKSKPQELLNTYKRAPYELIPFVISMFVIVLALSKYNVTKEMAEFLGSKYVSLSYGFSSLFMANLLNNIPMSVLYSSIETNLNPNSLTGALYASIIGSNIGAFITPVGALAGIMWMGILKRHEVKYTFLDFIKYGVLIGVPVSSVAIISLIIFN